MNCDHPGCRCISKGVERDGKRYCSQECASQGQLRTPGGCPCGHAACA